MVPRISRRRFDMTRDGFTLLAACPCRRRSSILCAMFSVTEAESHQDPRTDPPSDVQTHQIAIAERRSPPRPAAAAFRREILHSCSGAQSKCGGRAIKGGFRRRLAETAGVPDAAARCATKADQVAYGPFGSESPPGDIGSRRAIGPSRGPPCGPRTEP